jgi:hypothetical protein
MTTLTSRFPATRPAGRLTSLVLIAAALLAAAALAAALLGASSPAAPAGPSPTVMDLGTSGVPITCHVPASVATVEGIAPADSCAVPATATVPDLRMR